MHDTTTAISSSSSTTEADHDWVMTDPPPAIKRAHHDGNDDDDTKDTAPAPSSSPPSPSSSSSSNSWYRELLEGALLYIGCIVLPTLLGLAVRLYQQQQHHTNVDVDALGSGVVIEQRWSSRRLMCGWSYSPFRYSDALCGIFDQAEINAAADAADVAPLGTDTTNWKDTSFDGAGAGTRPIVPSTSSSSPHLLRDMQLIILLAIFLATLRILLVHLLVPKSYLTSPGEEFNAMMRCKSSHMLSASAMKLYSPLRSRRPPGGRSQQQQMRRSPSWTESGLSTVRRSLGHEYYNSTGDSSSPSPSPSSRRQLFSAPRYATAIFRLLYTTATTIVAYRMFHGAEFWPTYLFGGGHTRHCWDLSGNVIFLPKLDRDFDDRNDALTLYFVLQASYHLQSLCFQVLSLLVLLFHRTTGSGSGSGSEGGETNKEEKKLTLHSMKSGMKSYVRPLVEHVLAVTLIGAGFVFSGLRRIGAIGMFALDISSLALHVLQICMNAPPSWSSSSSPSLTGGAGMVAGDTTKQSSGQRMPLLWRRWTGGRSVPVLKAVYWCMVIPSFIYCRFFILPTVVWYSVAFESRDWFSQLERAMLPGSGQVLYVVFNGLVLTIQALNVIYFRRLLNHPHLRKGHDDGGGT